MKKIIATALLLLPMAASAQTDAYKSMVPDLPGIPEIYNAYVENGYSPLDAMIFTNWDVIEGLSPYSDELKDNNLEKEVRALKLTYQPKSTTRH